MDQLLRHWLARLAPAVALFFVLVAPAEAAKKCYDCHKDTKATFSSKKNIHQPVKAENCESCHKRHGFSNKLVLTTASNDLCYSCHADSKQKFASGQVHFPTDKGLCWDCHDPHSSNKPALIRKGPDESHDDPSGCLACHEGSATAVKSAKYPHEPFRKMQCTLCHDAHSSANASLLKAPVAELCQTCHKTQDNAFKKAHADKHTTGLACSDCHTGHSSNNAHLMSDRAHPPFAEGSCDACHTTPDENGKVTWAEGVTPGNVCGNCHTDQLDAAKKKVPHPAVEEGACDNCHTAHSSPFGNLLKENQAKLCTNCHSDVISGDSTKVVHAPVMNGNCSKCHEVHGSDNEKLLRTTDASLCLGCHTDFAKKEEAAKVKHAAAENCLQCHVPHESKNAKLLAQEVDKTCLGCHDPSSDIANANSFHEPYKSASCASCHDPHFSNNEHLTRAPGSQLCLVCHVEIQKRLALADPHPPAADDCTTCHTAHTSKLDHLLTSSESELCLGCHDQSSLSLDKKFTHPPAADGDCTGCHDPHGSNLPKLIAGRVKMVKYGDITVSQAPALSEKRADLCYTCHEQAEQDFRRQIIHKPVAEGACDACHESHGSDHRAFTKAKPAELCGTCHAINAELSAKHDGHNLAAADCTDCHNPHASDKPHLARVNNHPPFEERSCETCHEKEPDGTIKLTANLTELCSGCHDDISTAMSKSHQHVPFKAGECMGCHSMHASDHNNLLKAEGNDVCIDCHSDVGKLAKQPVQHRPFMEGKCRDCHSPHASDYDKLVNKPPEQFCLTCHTALKDQMAKGTVHEPARTGDCTACHLPHAGPTKALLVSSKQELCANCHDLAGAQLKQAHFGFDISTADCQNCHAAHVASKTSRALLLPDQHAPFAARNCVKCHQGPGDATLKAAKRELCLSCHISFKSKLTKAVVHAPAADSNGCTGCHAPHVGFGKSLQKKEGINTCLTCHTGKEFRGQFKHKAAFENGCGTCHDPHSANSAKLLPTNDIMALCLGCHKDAQKTHYHPMGKGYIDPNTKKDLVCTGCHSAHSSDFQPLVKGDKSRKLCILCHDLNM